MAEYRRGAHTGVRDPPALGVDYETPAASIERRGGDASARSDPGHLWAGSMIVKGHVAKDHVHLMVSIPPQVTISRLLQWLKGKTAHHLLAEFPH